MDIFIAAANSINCQFYIIFITHKLCRNCFLYVSLNDFCNVLSLIKWRTTYCCKYNCHRQKKDFKLLTMEDFQSFGFREIHSQKAKCIFIVRTSAI